MLALLDLAYPPACLACDAVLDEPQPFCEACALSVEPLGDQVCATCGEPDLPTGSRCPRCVLRPPPFLAAYAPFAHEGALARAIHRFKYEDHPELALPLAVLGAQAAAPFLATLPADTALLGLPLHTARLRARKYDQAQLLTAALAKTLRRRWLKDGLARVRATTRQVGLTEPLREANVRGAFEAGAELRGESLLLVDDVFTTGATARAASAALQEAGAREVRVLTLARAYGGP